MSDLKIEKYPSVIARPYSLACEQDEQWKDLLRFTFENLMTVLASYAASDLLNIYLSARNSSEELEEGENDGGSQDTNELINILKNVPELKRIGLEQMSLGKWAGVLRETTKVLEKYSDHSFIPELAKLFQPVSGNELWKNIDTLISIRNQDAHGAITQPGQLKKELKSRQDILDNILRKCDFLGNYSITVFNRLVLDSDSQQILGNKFSNTGSEEILAPTLLSPPLKEVVLVDSKMNGYIKLRPLILYAPIENQESRQLCLYSKRSGDKVHYLGIDGSVDMSIEKFDKENDSGIGEPWKYLNEIYSEEDVACPLFSAKLVAPQSIEVGDVGVFKIVLQNSGSSISVYDIECVLALPDIFHDIQLAEVAQHLFEIDKGTTTISIKVGEMSKGETLNFEFELIPQEQGTVKIPPGAIDYEYFRTESDFDDDIKTQGEEQLEGLFFEIHDPKNPDKMVPVINMNRRYLNQNGQDIHNTKIGENFIYELSIVNVGMSAAKSISLQVVFPAHLRLLEGTDDLSVDLNPHEKRSFRYLLTTRVPGLYKIYLRDISYKDPGENKYLSSFRDDYSIVVQSDTERQFQFELAEAIEDFTLDEAEKRMLELRKETLKLIHGENVDAWFEKALFDAAIEKVRTLVASIAKKRGHRVTEEFFNETKKQAKVTGNNPRKALIFSVRGVPFFGVDITKTGDIIFHSIDAKMVENIHVFKYSVLYAATSINGYILPLSLEYKPMLWSEKLNNNFFKKWINLCLTVVEKNYFPFLDLKEKLQEKLGIETPYLAGSFRKDIGKDQKFYFETGISTIQISYNGGSAFLYLHSGPEQSKLVDEMKEGLPGLVFLSKNPLGSKKIDLFSRNNDPERVNYWHVKSNRLTRLPCILVSDMSPQGIDNGVNIFVKMIDIHRLSISKQLVETNFATKLNFDSIKNNIDSLFYSGFAFREPIDSGAKAKISMKNSLEVYPFCNFKLGEARTHDCIGFLNAKGKSWDGYINFYNDNICSEISTENRSLVSVYSGWDKSLPTANRLFVMKQQEDDEAKEEKRTSMFFSLLYSAAKTHKNGSKAIWPKCMGEIMLKKYVTNFQDFELLEILLKGEVTIKEITKKYDSEGKKSALKRLLRFNEECLSAHNALMPVTVDRSKQTLTLVEEYREWIQELSENSGGLASLMGVNPLVEYLQPLASTCSFMMNKSADKYSNSLWGYYFLDEAKKTEIFISIKLFEEKLRVQVGSTITLDEHAQLIGNIDDSIKKKFGLYFSFEPFKERILHKSKATEFTFIKEHNDYDIMKNTGSMEELHEKLSSFFTVFFEMLKSGLKC